MKHSKAEEGKARIRPGRVMQVKAGWALAAELLSELSCTLLCVLDWTDVRACFKPGQDRGEVGAGLSITGQEWGQAG